MEAKLASVNLHGDVDEIVEHLKEIVKHPRERYGLVRRLIESYETEQPPENLIVEHDALVDDLTVFKRFIEERSSGTSEDLAILYRDLKVTGEYRYYQRRPLNENLNEHLNEQLLVEEQEENGNELNNGDRASFGDLNELGDEDHEMPGDDEWHSEHSEQSTSQSGHDDDDGGRSTANSRIIDTTGRNDDESDGEAENSHVSSDSETEANDEEEEENEMQVNDEVREVRQPLGDELDDDDQDHEEEREIVRLFLRGYYSQDWLEEHPEAIDLGVWLRENFEFHMDPDERWQRNQPRVLTTAIQAETADLRGNNITNEHLGIIIIRVLPGVQKRVALSFANVPDSRNYILQIVRTLFGPNE